MASFSILTDKINTVGTNPTKDGFLETNTTITAQTGSVAVDTYVFGDDTGLILAGSDATKGAWTLTVNGAIFGAGTDVGSDGFGVFVSQTSTALLSTITVGVDGDIFGKNGGIVSNHSTSVTNSGVIGSETESAIQQSIAGHTKGFTITNNKGALIQSAGGFGIELVGDVALLSAATVVRTITNAGTIVGSTGAIETTNSLGNDKVTNSGTFGTSDNIGSGNVLLGGGTDSLTNSGNIYGRVELGSGDSTVTNSKLITGVSALVAAITGGQEKDSVTNSGTIGLVAVAESGKLELAGGNDVVNNTGTIVGSIDMGSGDDSVTSSKTIAGTVTFGGGTGNDKLTNSGTIGTGAALSGNVTFVGGNDTFTNSGTVYGNVDFGSGDDSLTNSKTITGAIVFGGGGQPTTLNDKLTNSGTIGDAAFPVATAVQFSGGNDTVTNFGVIAGGVDLGNGNNTLSNTKSILGDVSASGNFKNVITNSGTIGIELAGSGDLTLGAGNDVVNNTGVILGALLMGDGDDTLTSSKNILGVVTFGGGGVSLTANDKFTNSGNVGSDSISGDVTFFATLSNDTFSNAGTVYGDVHLGQGNDSFTNTKSILGTVTFGTGDTAVKLDDKFTNSGTIGIEATPNSGNVTGGAGHDTFANTGTIYGSLSAGAGNDTISSTKALAGDLIAGSGDNVITTGGTIGGDILGGADNDTLTNSATVSGYVDLGAGKLNTFTNSGKILGDNAGVGVAITSATAGANPETTPGDRYVFSNTGTIVGDVVINKNLASVGTKLALNAGTFTNSGTIGVVETDDVAGVESDVYLSDGVDIVNNTGTVTGTFFLGADNDKFVGGANNDRVQDGKGADDIQLGGDKYNAIIDPESPGDVYYAGGAGGVEETDLIDGGVIGAGDAYVAGTITSGILDGVDNSVFINLDAFTQAENENLVWGGTPVRSIAAQTAYGIDISGSANGSKGKDTIKNFEWAVGGDGADLIFGSSVANVLFGDNPNASIGGSDIVYGGAGNDTIFGGAGDDVLVGGAGKDMLTGGEGADVFAYVKRTDSGTLVSARDIIYDFVQGEDLIDLSALAIDEGLKSAPFEYIGLNKAWTTLGGQTDVRTIWTANSTIIQIDLLDNGKPLVSIELDGRLTLSDDDFIFSFSVAANGADNTLQGTDLGDTIDGVGGNDLIFGLAGDDDLEGGTGNDRLIGGDGNDSLSGEDDNDTLIGGAGNDDLTGGGGDDAIVGGDGVDTAYYTAGVLAGDYGLTLNADGTFEVDGGMVTTDGIDTLSGVEFLDFNGDVYGLQLGTNAAENFDGTAGNDIIFSGGGNDDIDAATVPGGDDILFGGAGNDSMVAGSGGDVLGGGTGADSVEGGTGADTFFFASGDSGQTTGNIDFIADYDGTGDVDIILFDGTLAFGGNANAATATEASIDANGVATFFAGSGTTLADALSDIATRFTAATDTAGEFALFQISGGGDYHLFISDGVAGLTANDVVVELDGVTTVNTVTPTGGELLIV